MSESTRSPWQLDLDALARYPRPGTVVPGSLAFSPDSRLLTYLFSDRGDLARDLWALDVETGERRILAQPPGGGTTDENVNPEEALRRERQRLREGGITHYAWAKDADRILVPINGKLYVTSSGGESLQLVAPSDEPAADARLTPDGTRVVCVRGRELWRTDLATGETLQLTSSSSETIANGLAEFIAQEEMGRDEGFWIDPRGERVAYAHVDEGSIPDYPIVHQGEPQWRVEHHRYPFAGGPNARVRLGVVGIDGGVTTWLDLGPDPEVYLARVDWSPLGRLFVQLEQRDQQRLELWRYDVSQGTRTLLLVEATRPWVNLHHDLRFVGETETFTWSSEGSGYRQLSLHDPDGSELCDLTSGERPVERLLHVDAERRRAYYTAPGSSPLTRYVWSVSLDANVPRYATTDARDSPPGFHGAVFSPNGSYWAHSFDSGTQAPTVTLESVDGGERRVIHQGESIQQVMPGVRPPDLVQLAARDGTKLYGAIYRPARGSPPFPTVVSVYGGPHVQQVGDSWGMSVDLRAQYLAAHGFLVFKLDNRGSARRGLAFEGAIHRRLGTIEVEDQVAGVRWLVEQGLTDPARVGVYGWSYGGYLTAMCLLKAPDTFRVGVAGAPVTDWDGYDTHYTERYMDSPQANPDGYREGSALTFASQLAGKLLLVHGMVDENVHFRHTARLSAALERAGRPFDLMVFPEERHMPRDEPGRRYLEAQVADYFLRHLA